MCIFRENKYLKSHEVHIRHMTNHELVKDGADEHLIIVIDGHSACRQSSAIVGVRLAHCVLTILLQSACMRARTH